MMIQAGGAMALFVLRLAGLLSLEKTLGDNSTSSSSANDSVAPSFLTQAHFGEGKSSNVTDPSNSFNLSSVRINAFPTNESDEYENDSKRFFTSQNESDILVSGKMDEKIRKFSNKSYEKGEEMLRNFSSSDDNETWSAKVAPRNRDTGFSPVPVNPINTTNIPYFATIKYPNTSSLNLNKPQLKNEYHELEAPDPDYVTKDIAFLDYQEFLLNSSSRIPELSSRSLISPVPHPGHRKPSLEEDEAKMTETKDKTQDSSEYGVAARVNNTLGTPPSEVDTDSSAPAQAGNKTRGVGPIFPKNASKRNNPYPYGPKVLPEHKHKYSSVASASADSKEDRKFLPGEDKENNQSEVDENLEGFDEYKDYYELEGEDGTDAKIDLVKTEKPIVLFHFNKPGYSPKIPDSSLPPTRPPTPSDPWDCSPRCPRYTLLDWNPEYDIRQYPETTWISTVIIAENRIMAELEGYMKVQDYFYGLNDRGQLINLTVPIVTQIKYGRHPGVLKEFTDYSVSLYINHVDDPLNFDLPTPISNEVLIDRLESKTVFVAGFEANVWDVTEAFLETKATELMEKLRQNGEAFMDRYYYLSSYSRPELYQPVYYELWIYSTAFRTNSISLPPIGPRKHPPPNQITTQSINRLCRGVECPSFEVLRTYRYGIQKRRYYDGMFVTTSPGVCEFTTLSIWKGFMPLHLYKHGVNSHLEVIEATRPIGLVHVKEDSTSTTECPQNMTMAIYLPKRLHSNPPLTGYDAPAVTISALEDVVVYAYTVGGYLLEPDRVRKELADLKYRLTEFGACFKKDEYYVVVYDFIIRYHGRQNEIWVVAENCKATLNG